MHTAVGRRAVLRGSLLGAVGLGLGVTGLSGVAAADERGKHGDLDHDGALDVLVATLRKELESGKDVTVPDFGTFAVVRRSLRSDDYLDADSDGDGLGDGTERGAVNVVTFSPSDALADELDLIPGEGDSRRKRRVRMRHRRRESGIVVDGDYLEREAGLSKADAKRALAALDAFVTEAKGALKKGDRIALIGFGSFSISKRSARTGRNPQTGKEIQIAAKNVVKFKAGAELSKAVN
ncbi:nucleoid DNA-binding protein [Halogranum gelatinilyticum]|uniref:Nucleoid DNA-binding protein n=2 Tax=Halogranum gelatinilyticum TaxID=660521 RepID=A0A1G9SQ55_9EURY|nr:nucleoid DNA-binding protein [Halogranum gelatinilyticum]